MGAIIKIKDEYFGTTAVSDENIPPLRLASERTSAREIIVQRVLSEVEDRNSRFLNAKKKARRTRSFIVDVQPTSPEAQLNRPLKPLPEHPHLLDPDLEIERALGAFARQRFVMLFNGRQVEDLDQKLAVTGNSEMVFLHLTPLRGG